MIGPIEFGIRWRNMIRGPLAPTDRDASTNSRSFNDSTTPRTIRATAIQPTADKQDDHEPNRRLVAHDRFRHNGYFGQHVAEHEQGDEDRERQEDVGDAHQDVVEQTAAVAGERADDGADACRR